MLILPLFQWVTVANELMRLLHKGEKPDNRAFAQFVVTRLLPNCKKTAKLVRTIAAVRDQKQAASA